MPIDPLDRLLDEAAPRTRFDATGRARRTVIRAARRGARVRAPQATRAIVATGLTLALLGAGGAAAFASPDIRDWFFSGVQDPYVTVHYTVPSGAVCTDTSGDPIANDPAAADALRTWLASADVMSLVDIDAALAQVRSYDEYDRSQIGSDDEYRFAMGIAVVLAARAELERQGFPPGSIDMWKGEGECLDPDA
jgi:hypothetical protein